MPTFLARLAPCLALMIVGLIGTIAHVEAQAQTTGAVVVNEYDVFVDPPTAFAFIKLPSGWKFIGKLDADQLRHLPPGTLTSLLPPDEETVKLAAETKPAKRKS